MSHNTEARNPIERYRGIWRDNGPRTLEGIIAEQREMRGFDEYDYWVADGGDPDLYPDAVVPSPFQRTSWPQAPSRDFNPGSPTPR